MVSRWGGAVPGTCVVGEARRRAGEDATSVMTSRAPSLVRAPPSYVPYGPEQQTVTVPAGPGGGGHWLLQEELLAGRGRGRASSQSGGGRARGVVEQQRLDVEHGFSDEGDGSRRIPLAETHEGSQPASLAGVFARGFLAERTAVGRLSIRP